jgi:hypothetical protein
MNDSTNNICSTCGHELTINEDGDKICLLCGQPYEGEVYDPGTETKSPEIQKFLDVLSMKYFGHSRSEAKEQGICVVCGKPATQFKDELNKREWSISGFCQECQDKTFGEDNG